MFPGYFQLVSEQLSNKRMPGPNSIPVDSLRCGFIIVKSGERCKFKHSNGAFCGKHTKQLTERDMVIRLIAKRFDDNPEDIDLEQMCESPTSRSIVEGFLFEIGTSKTIEQLL